MSERGRGPLSQIAAGVARAVERRHHLGERGGTTAQLLHQGQGWSVDDVLCTCGPDDRSFEERHSGVSIAVVLAGTFQYRAGNARHLLTPGSLLLGNDGDAFECGHDHGAGDRCLAFRFAPEFSERIAFDVAGGAARRPFGVGRLPPLRTLAPAVARCAAGLLGVNNTPWGELAVELAATALGLVHGVAGGGTASIDAEARVSATVRAIEREPALPHTLDDLAASARSSPYHYLRTFQRVTGVTPHQFILRTRLRDAATRLATRTDKVIDVAVDAGFNDLSHFNHAFRAEFGRSPREFRVETRRPISRCRPGW